MGLSTRNAAPYPNSSLGNFQLFGGMYPAYSSRVGKGVSRIVVIEGVAIILIHYCHFVDKNTDTE